MMFEWRVLTIALAVFATVGIAASAIVPMLLRRVPGTGGDGATRARDIARVRLFPATFAGLAAAIVVAAFLGFEPRRDDEALGWAVRGVAAIGALILATALWRGAQVVWLTRRLTRNWLAHGTPISLPGAAVPVLAVNSRFPIVAVVGLRHPRLIVARSVLDGCTPEELQAVVAHEYGHIRRRDNFKRVLLAIAPDILSWLPVSGRVFEEWRNAAEQAADEDAARQDEHSRLNLASALVKVARLAARAPGRVAVPASAFYCGEDIDRRIRRLLDADVVAPMSQRPVAVVMGMMFAAGTAVAAQALEPLHLFVERAIHALP